MLSEGGEEGQRLGESPMITGIRTKARTDCKNSRQCEIARKPAVSNFTLCELLRGAAEVNVSGVRHFQSAVRLVNRNHL